MENKKGIIRLIIATYSLAIVSILNSNGQNLNELRDMWKHKYYKEVLPLLVNYSAKTVMESQEVSYLIGTSLCRLNDANANYDGREFFRILLQNGSLNSHNRSIVKTEMESCGSIASPIAVMINFPQSTSGLHGTKMLYDPEMKNIINRPADIIRTIPDSIIASRLFNSKEMEKGTDYYHKLFPNYNIFGDSLFRIISKRNYTGFQQAKMLGSLNHYLQYFLQRYNLTPPAYIITVYLTEGKGELLKLADSIYGLRVSPLSIGFSNAEDYSAIVVSTGTQISSSVYHELFHVISNNMPGIIPTWLDEGIASIYEWSDTTHGSLIRGKDDWRGDILRNIDQPVPHINELVQMDWGTFNCEISNFSPIYQAVNYAVARYFMMYLDEQDILPEYLKRMRNIEMEYVTKHPSDFNIRLLEEVCGGISADSIDKSFRKWLQNKFYIHLDIS
jgi:hypothetical protein